MADRPLHYKSITELAVMLRSGETTPTALTEHLLGRIEKLNGPLNAFNLVTSDRAMAEAKSAEGLLAAGASYQCGLCRPLGSTAGTTQAGPWGGALES